MSLFALRGIIPYVVLLIDCVLLLAPYEMVFEGIGFFPAGVIFPDHLLFETDFFRMNNIFSQGECSFLYLSAQLICALLVSLISCLLLQQQLHIA